MLRNQFFEYILTCGVLPRLGLPGLRVEFQTVEKNFPHLCGRSDVEAFADERIDLLLESRYPFLHVAGGIVESRHIQSHSRELHAGEHPDKW